MSDAAAMQEIASALSELVELVSTRPAEDAQASAIRAAAAELSAPLAELLEAVEKAGPQNARAIADALAAMPAPTVSMPAPTINVPPAQVHVEVPRHPGWRFEFEYSMDGELRVATARPIS